MRKYLIWGLVAIIAAGAIAYGLFVYPTNQFRAALDQSIATLPPGYAVTYGSARYSPLTGTAEVRDLVVHAASPAPVTADATIASALVRHPNAGFMAAWNSAVANPAAWKPDQALPVADHVVLQGVKYQSGIINGEIGSGSLDGLRIYPWALLQPGLPNLAAIQGMFSDLYESQLRMQETVQQAVRQGQPMAPDQLMTLQQEQLAKMIPLLRVEAAVVLGSGYDGYDFSQMVVSMQQPATGSLPAGNIRISVGKLHGGSFDRGLGGEAEIEGLSEEIAPGFKFTADRATQGGLAMRDPASRLIEGGAVSLDSLNGLALEHFEADGINMSVPTGGDVQVQSFSFSNLAFDHAFLKSGAFAFTGLKLTRSSLSDPRSQLMFQQLGLDALTLNFGANYAWDADKKMVSLSKVGLKIDELGSLSIDAALGSFGPPDPNTSMQGTLASASIRYDDASLIDRLLGNGQKLSPDQLKAARAGIAQNLIGTLTELPLDQAKIAPSVKAIEAFAETPGSLTIKLDPPTPVALADLKTIGAAGLPNLITSLGLSVSANDGTPQK